MEPTANQGSVVDGPLKVIRGQGSDLWLAWARQRLKPRNRIACAHGLALMSMIEPTRSANVTSVALPWR
jgi:hypothetical protein